MAPGTKLRCVDAKEPGIPISEGAVYTVKTYRVDGEAAWGDGSIPGRAKLPGVELRELPNQYFMASRFIEI